VLSALGVADHLRREGLIFADTPSAIAQARRIVHVEHGTVVSA
jgi:SulP family sulfate permease